MFPTDVRQRHSGGLGLRVDWGDGGVKGQASSPSEEERSEEILHGGVEAPRGHGGYESNHGSRLLSCLKRQGAGAGVLVVALVPLHVCVCMCLH